LYEGDGFGGSWENMNFEVKNVLSYIVHGIAVRSGNIANKTA